MILSNQVRCHKCGDTPFSAHRHDYRSCACGSIFVDGGMAYLRRGGGLSAYDDLSIELPDEACKEAIAAADAVIGDGTDYVPTNLSDAIMTVLAVNHHICITGLSTDDIEHAIDAASKWTFDNRRNGLGALCAVARFVRDAGGTWVVPEVTSNG